MIDALKEGPSVSMQQSEPGIGLGECMSVREKDSSITYRDANLLGAYDRNTRQVGILQKEVPVARQQMDFGGSKRFDNIMEPFFQARIPVVKEITQDVDSICIVNGL